MDNPSERAARLEAISTRWTLFRQAHGEVAASTAEARNALVLRYLPAIRRYVGAIVQNNQEADDVAQDVVVRLLSGDFAGADPDRGRFRDLLKVVIRNMVRNRWNRQKTRRAAHVDVANVAAEDTDEERWTAEWRQSVLELAWHALQQYERTHSGSVAFTVMELRAGRPDDSSEQLAARLSEKLGQPVRADAVRQRLRRARLQFADLLLAEVARGLRDPTAEQIEDELAELGLLDTFRELLPEGWSGASG
jgi:RNA polymerase sigma factor (sigma-70 family)